MRIRPYLRSAFVGVVALIVCEVLLMASFFYGTLRKSAGGYADDAMVDSTSLTTYLLASNLFAWVVGVVAFGVAVYFTLPQRAWRRKSSLS